MPVGQFTGPRSGYIYTSDALEEYLVLLDETLASIAGTGLTLWDGTGTPASKPPRFKLRVVHWQSLDGANRKSLVCGKNDASLYAQANSVLLTIDGVAGRTTGRTGERQTYVKRPAVV